MQKKYFIVNIILRHIFCIVANTVFIIETIKIVGPVTTLDLLKARKMWYYIFSYMIQQEDIQEDYGFQTVMNVSFSLNLTLI